jgi:hypothetical protein
MEIWFLFVLLLFKRLQNCPCVSWLDFQNKQVSRLDAEKKQLAGTSELWPQRDSTFHDKKQAIILTDWSSIAQSRGNSRRPARLENGQSLLLRLGESTGEQLLLTAGMTGTMWRKLPLLRELRVIDKPARTVALSVDVTVSG